MNRQLLVMTTMTATAAARLLPACARVKVDPIEVKPIHIVQDINITLKVDREPEQFFAFETPATQPTPNASLAPRQSARAWPAATQPAPTAAAAATSEGVK